MTRFLIFLLTALTAVSSYAVSPSGKLPVMTVVTENKQPIESKEIYLNATYTLDPKGCKGVEAFSGNMQIRGRGNYTWWGGFSKKPYRIKLENKAALLGMKKSKHFGLLANADDNLGFLRSPLGFRLAEMIGMEWTPKTEPVELVVNGDYRGLYFLTELIRVDKDRVNVVDQEEDPVADPTGGWLCEIDNYEEDLSEQIRLTDNDGNRLWITHKSPEILNDAQDRFLRGQYTAMNTAVYAEDPGSTEWEKYIDRTSLAQMFIVYELLDNLEGFNGSCYMHRQRGEDEKWKFGPVWDFGQVYNRPVGTHIYEESGYDWCVRTWIPQLVEKKSFEDEYKALFRRFVTKENFESVIGYLEGFADRIAAAAVADAQRYNGVGTNEQLNWDVAASLRKIRNNLARRIAFLSDEYGIPVEGIEKRSGIYLMGEINNWSPSDDWEFIKTGDNTYELSDVVLNGTFKIASEGWAPHNWGCVTASTVTAVYPDTPLPLACGLDYNDIRLGSPTKLPSVILTIDEPFRHATLLLSTKASADGILAGPDTAFIVSSNTIRANSGSAFDVFDLAGREIIRGAVSVTVAPGVYIVRSGSGASAKVCIN